MLSFEAFWETASNISMAYKSHIKVTYKSVLHFIFSRYVLNHIIFD